MGSVTATSPTATRRVAPAVAMFAAFVASGFRRYSTYAQATVAGAVTNGVFGFLRCFVFLAVAGGTASGIAAGYRPDQLVTFVWVGQGLLPVILMWRWTDLADRIRTGEVASDLLRPVHPVVSYLAVDLGRAAYATVTRCVAMVALGAIFFDYYWPNRWFTGPLFVVSAVLSVVVCFACRYLVNSTAYWLGRAGGPMLVWTLASGVLAGLYFPLRFLPVWAQVVLWVATPFPSLMQTPLDVVVERDGPAVQIGLVGLQVVWAALLLAACVGVQRLAERRMVIQGG